MPDLPRKDVVVQLTKELLNALHDKFWYAPVSTTLMYDSKRLPLMQTEIRHKHLSAAPYEKPVWFFGGPKQHDISVTGNFGIVMGSNSADNLYAADMASGFLWGGKGADRFHVGYDVKTQKLETIILDASKEDQILITIAETVNQRQFNLAVSNAENWFKGKVQSLTFLLTTNENNFQGSIYNDSIKLNKAGTARGGAGNDDLWSVAGSATLYGEAGDDTLAGQSNTDRLYGGAGRDVFYVSGGAQVMDATKDDTIIVVDTTLRYDDSPARVIYAIDNIFSGKKKNLKGGLYNDTFTGSGLGDQLTGLQGHDNFSISGKDVVTDAERGDIIEYFFKTTQERNGALTRYGNSGAQLNLACNFEQTKSAVSISGWIYDDQLVASQGNSTIYGGDGNDIIEGLQGDDLLYGGAGNDTITDMSGRNQMFGGDGNDSLLANAGHNTMRGGNGQDTITGGTGSDSLYGESGNDVLNGMGGDDSFWGGTGQDTLNGGHGDDRLYGDRENDVVMGGAGSDMLDGGDGNDTLVGGSGEDTMYGSNGADMFVFVPGEGNSIDTIMDFQSGVDKVDLSAFSLMDGYNASVVKSGMRFDSRSQRLTIDANGDGYTDITIAFRGTSSQSFNLANDILLNNLRVA